MDYSKMLDFHKKNNCAATIAVLEVPAEEASRFGIMNTKDNDRIYEFEEKPANPKSNLASMGIYIFTWSKLREVLIKDNKIHPDSDFGMHIIPRMLSEGQTLYAYRFKDFWKDVGTIESYWQANMELIKTLPSFNLYEDFWKIYTNTGNQPPQYIGNGGKVKKSIVSDGCEIYGEVIDSVLSPNVCIEKGAVVRDSILMTGCTIGKGTVIDRCIMDEYGNIGSNVKMGVGENIANEDKPKIYNTGITVLGEHTSVPDGVVIGKNCVLYGKTNIGDYPDSNLSSGKSLIREEA
jgi:glucose-1-phosphate adenylyltransferase